LQEVTIQEVKKEQRKTMYWLVYNINWRHWYKPWL